MGILSRRKSEENNDFDGWYFQVELSSSNTNAETARTIRGFVGEILDMLYTCFIQFLETTGKSYQIIKILLWSFMINTINTINTMVQVIQASDLAQF